MPASKMGFAPGVEVTLDNALKMLMVKSPNDVAVMIAESIDGSVEAFADEMNATAAKLGMRESHFVNPNGLHDPAHVSSARDMAIVARALLRDFPEQRDLYGIGALQLGDEIIANHNGLLGRYPGADGMKTGFTCPAGFNVVATATHGGRRLIVVVLGAPSPLERTMEAARLFDAGFAKWGGGEGPPESLPIRPCAARPTCAARSARGAIAPRSLAAEEENAGSLTNVAGRGAPYSRIRAGAGDDAARTRPKPVHFDPRADLHRPQAGLDRAGAAAKPSGDRRGARPAPIRRAPTSTTSRRWPRAPKRRARPAALKGALKPVKLAPLAARPHTAGRRQAAEADNRRQGGEIAAASPPTSGRPLSRRGRSRRREKCLGFARLWSIRRRIGPSKQQTSRDGSVRRRARCILPPSPRAASGHSKLPRRLADRQAPSSPIRLFFCLRADAQAP